MKFIFLIILSILAMPHHLIANEESGCDQIIEEVEITPTMNLTSYFKFLLDSGVISAKNLEAFRKSLYTNKFINPVEHTMTAQGLIVNPAANRAHYLQIQKYLDYEQSNPNFLHLDELDQQIAQLAQSKNLTTTSRTDTRIDTNFHLIIEQIVDGGLGNIDDLLDSLANNMPESSTRLALQLLNYHQVPYYQATAANLLTKIYAKQDYDSLFYLMRLGLDYREIPFKVSEYIDPFLTDNGTEEYYRFVTKILTGPISDQYKEQIILKLKKTSDQNLLRAIKNLAESNMHGPLSIAATKALYQSQKPEDIIPYFIDLATHPKAGFWVASTEAMKYLFEFKIRGYSFDLPSYEHFNRDGYSLFRGLSSFYGKSDPASLQFIKEAVHSSKNRTTKSDAINLLEGRKDNESLLYIKNIFSIFSSEKQILQKIRLISGRDAPWVLNFLKQNFNNKNIDIKNAAYNALENMSSLESRNMIEELYLKTGTEQLLKALESRPEDDVIYFVDKYINSKNESHRSIVTHSLKSLHGLNNQKIKNICNEQIKKDEGALKNACINYLKSLPLQENLPLWRTLVKFPLFETENVEALEKLAGLYDQEIVELCFQALKNNIRDNEMPHHASACFNYLTSFPTQQFIDQWKQLATPPYETKIKKLALEKILQANDQNSKNLFIQFLEDTKDESKYLLSELINWAPNPKILSKCSAQKGPNISLGCLTYLYHQPITDHLRWWKNVAQKPYSDLMRGMALTKFSEHFDLEVGQILKKIINEKDPNFSPRARGIYLFHYLNILEKTKQRKIPISEEEIAIFG